MTAAHTRNPSNPPNGLPPARVDRDDDRLQVEWWDYGDRQMATFHRQSEGWRLARLTWDDREETYATAEAGPDPRLEHLHTGLRTVVERFAGPLVDAGSDDLDPLDVLARASDDGTDPLTRSEAVERVDTLVATPDETGEIIERADARGYIEVTGLEDHP